MTAVGNAPNLAAVDYDPFAQTALSRVVPVTEPQREVWLADKLGTEGSLAFNESVSIRLRGALDVPALEAAVRGLAARHESLRATLSPTGDELCIAEDFSLELERHDLRALPEDERDAALQARQRAAVETPFDLEQGPLVRAELVALSAQEHVLLLNAHHIVCDGWSFGVLVADLAALYAAEIGQGGAPLEPAVSFADYAWSRAAMAQAAGSADDERYWLSRFADIPSNLDLPTDRPRPRFRGFRAGREDLLLDAALVASLRKLGARNGASLFATLFTGFTTLMRRLSGQSDVVVGIAAAGQSLDGYGSLVGHCVNILPVRSDAMPGESFSSVLAHTGSTLLDAFEHQQYTFGTLLQKLAIPRDPGRLPLVSVLFNLDQSIDGDAVRFPGLEFDVRANARSYENFELFVNAVPENGGLRLECQYSSDLFDAATVRRWLGLMETMLRSAVAEPDASWDALEWLSPAECEALDALQPAPSIYDGNWLAHQRFAARATDTPDAVAVSFGDLHVSYAALDRRANAIAHALRERGVRRGALVGVCLNRGPDLLAATLGILKAGGAFVPLDPTYPADRLNYMVGDANLAILLSEDGLAAGIDCPRERVLALDSGLDEAAWTRTGPLPDDENAAAAESPAYVIYTSGSTGKPKGVVVPHRALVNHLTSMAVRPGLSGSDHLVAVTTTSFDISVLELFLPLVVGARIVLAGRDDVRDGMALRRLVEDTGATVMQATPSGWRVLIDAGWNGGPHFKALCGGEGLPPELVPALLERVGELWNMYGPTETTIWSTCARIEDASSGAPIGTPIQNTTVRVLDEQGRQCPIGVPGELWIGGDGVTLGYLNRPELTDERFVRDPWAASPAARMYRTGDRGRWRNDGLLEHLGRLDFQVKVRGYRIELGEIESNIAGYPGVAQCVVMAREDRPGDVRLVAYAVPAAEAGIDESALQAHLRASLPDYMVPQHVVTLPALPLTLNGKVDRKALPAPDLGSARAATRIAPRNDLERSVASIMEAVLALPDIGIDDDFFALGGHSLLAAQLTSRLNRELGVGLTMRALFDAPTVARLAALIAEQPA
ncbi:MAG TPA: amino acid adenylation domain-containing protein, partial [Lysobacter sp.]